MGSQEFLPFYEKIANRLSDRYVAGRVAVSMLLGLTFLLPHYAAQFWAGEKKLDWSWFLAVLIAGAMLCLYYATYTLKALLPEMETRLEKSDQHILVPVLQQTLSDRNFKIVGLIFGLLNCAFGYLFGLPYSKGPTVVTILIGYFLAGFVCGMAVWGIYGVFEAIKAFSPRARKSFEFTEPDHCGGTGFLGDALIVFGSVTLIVGVMISIYVLKTNWQRDNSFWMISLKSVWVVFPYLCSLLALVGPAVPINRQLTAYKAEQDSALKRRVTDVRKNLENDDEASDDKRKNWREQYVSQQSQRSELHAMRTWPFGLASNLKYLSVLGGNLFAHISAALTTGGSHPSQPFF
jgi:hypothetical protein